MPRLVRPAIALALLLVLPGPGQAALSQADFQAKLDAVLKQVAAYDFGGDPATPIALAELSKATYGQPAQRRELADRLAALLSTNVPGGAKELACRQLSLIGGSGNVAAVAALLTDEKLSHMARYALERIPGPAPDEALRQALAKVKGKLLIGVIHSIGVRHDPAAVNALADRLADSDREVAAAAARALGKIPTPAATKALWGALSTASGRACPAVGEACLLCAERLAAADKRDEAIAIYDRLRSADTPKPIRRAATRGAILVRQSIDLLVEQLQSADDEMFALGLGLVRQMPAAGIAAAAARELPCLAAWRQIRLVQALADRGDKTATPAVLALAEKGDMAVRLAAIEALAKLGNVGMAVLLIQTAAGEKADLAAAAAAALANMPDRDLDVLLGRSLRDANPKIRRLAAEILGQRHSPSAADGLFGATADADKTVRQAAIKALGATVKLPDLGRLAEFLLKAPGPAERTAAEEAIAAASAGIADKDACADKLLALLAGADIEGKSALLRTLSQIGGPKALASVCAAMKDPSQEIQDVAARALSNWTTAEAMDELAAIAKDSSNQKHKVLALRGYVRQIGLSDARPDQKLGMCDKAMRLADRDDERKLVLGALGGISTPQALDRALSYLDQPGLNSEAASAAIAVAWRLLRADPAAVARAMTKVAAAAKNPGVKKRAEDLLNRAQGKGR